MPENNAAEQVTVTDTGLTATTDPGATDFVLEIPADTVVHYSGYQYAAHYQVRRLRAGSYPVRQMTIHGRDPYPAPGADKTTGKPYYASVWVPAEVVAGHADLEPVGSQIQHHVWPYHYDLTDGYAAVWGHAPDLPLHTKTAPAGWFRKASPADGPAEATASENSATEPFTPAAEPEKKEGDRSITATWNVGQADENGWQPQARLMVHHWPSVKRYDAQLRVGRVKKEGVYVSEMLTGGALAHKVVILEQDANRYSSKTLNTVYETALALLRSRFEDGEDAVTDYFDPESDKHAA